MALIAVFTVGISLTGGILWQNILIILIGLGLGIFYLYLFYVGYRQKKRKLQYPLVPPEGKGDVYLPRTDIPRPIYADFREMREKKRKLEKLKKMQRKKK